MNINVATTNNHPHPKKRAQAAATFEVLPKLLGFGPDVFLQGITVDYGRNIVKFHFSGAGLIECEEELGFSLDAIEGAEAREIIPPAWT